MLEVARLLQAKEKGTKLIDEDGLLALVKATEHLVPGGGKAVSAEAAPAGDLARPLRSLGAI